MEEQLLHGYSSRSSDSDSTTTTTTSKLTFTVVFSSLIGVFGSFAFGCASGYSSPSQSGIMKDMRLTIAQYSLFGSFMTLGSVFGSTMSGRLSDCIGRKKGMWFLQVFFISGWLTIAFAKNVWWLYIGRMCIGFSNGIQNYVSVVYVAEITPPNFRGAFTMSTQFMLCSGITLMYFIGNLIPWRMLAFIGTIPCILQVIGLVFIPESPRWLAKVGREKESITSLRRLRGDDADVSYEAADIMASTQPCKEDEATGITQLLDRKYARVLIVGIGVCILLPLTGGTAILFYASSILEAAGCNVSIGTIITALIQLPFSVFGILAMDRIGRRPLLMVDLAGTCVGGILAGVAFLLQDLGLLKNFTPTMVLMSMIISFAFYAMAIGLPFVIMAELFPIKINGYAGSLASLGYCFSSWIVAYSFNFLFQWSSSGAFFTFAIFAALTILFVAKLIPETKGLSLEEITALWLDKNNIEQNE